jgi:polysaccharide biosynthesis transport protein
MRDRDWGAISVRLNQDLAESLRILRRRLPLTMATVAVVMSLVLAFIGLATPWYTASSQIVFDSKVPPSIDGRPMFGGETPDDAFILSEVDVIRSRSLANRVIEKLRLDQNPDFDRSLSPDNSVTALLKRYVPERWLPIRESTASPQIERERLIDEFERSVTAKLNPRSRTVNISFTASQPQLAADTLNTLTDLYLVARMEDRLNNVKRASAWLTEQIQKLRNQAQQSEQEVENYRATHNLFETSRETLISKQVGELNSRLTGAEIERRTAEDNVVQVRRLLNGAGNINATPQVLQSELIRKYREDELALERREAQMAEEYGNQHPARIQLKAEKQRLQDKIRIEIERIALSLDVEAQLARNHEKSLKANLQNVKETMAQANAASIGLRTLERQADASKITLERMMGTLLQTSAEENAKSQTPDARIISSAPVPEKPSFPRKTLLLFSGLLASAFAGVLLAFLVEHLDGGFRGAEEVEAAGGPPVLAQVPIVRGGKAVPTAYALDHPRSAYAAAVHAIYARLLLMSGERPPRVLLFTSAKPEEGKSTISLSLARQQAQSGRRVVFVEVDFYRSCISRVAGVGAAPGLMDVLSGAAGLKDVIQPDSRSTVDLIVAGTQQATNSGKPAVGAVGTILNALRDEYDVIVLDAPPVLGLADANIFSAVADATLMIVQWGKTRREVFKYGVGEIIKFGGRIDGVILSKVDTRKQAYYGYGDSHAYTGKAAKAYVG